MPDLSPRNSGQACECMVQEVKLGTEFVAETKIQEFDLYWICFCLVLFIFSHVVYRGRRIPARFDSFEVFISSNLLLLEGI